MKVEVNQNRFRRVPDLTFKTTGPATAGIAHGPSGARRTKPRTRAALPIGVAAWLASAAGAQSLDAILDYREYSPAFASAGEPTAGQLPLIRDAGFVRVVYIAFSTDRDANAPEHRPSPTGDSLIVLVAQRAAELTS